MIHSFRLIDKEKQSTFSPSEETVNRDSSETDAIILIWDVYDEVIFSSKSVETIFDVRKEEVIGGSWQKFFPKELVEAIKNFFESDINHSFERRFILSLDNGKVYAFHAVVESMNWRGDYFFVCTLNNLTLVEKLKSSLTDLESLAIASQMATGLVHEIRNPLTALKGFLQLIQAGVKQKEQYYRVMISEIAKLEQITSELLQIGKPVNRVRQNESIATIINDVIFLMKIQSNYRDITFKVKLDDDVEVYCNAPQIKQVFINIIKNGIEAMDEKGTITIETTKRNGTILIHISDEGKGIAPNELKQLHEPFFTTKQNGTGLGLLISQHILHEHRGDLVVQSSEGVGSTFSIILPVATS